MEDVVNDGFFNLWDTDLSALSDASGRDLAKGSGSEEVSTIRQRSKKVHRESPQHATNPLDLHDFLSYPWPDWFTEFRPHQLTAIQEILDAYTRVPIVFLDAPVGSGKTLIAEAVRVALGQKGLYVCSGLQLQDQFAHDFPYSRVLKGRSNYPTESFPYPRYSAADCNKQPGDPSSCLFCVRVANCPYEEAKRNALAAEIAAINTTYLLYEANSAGRFSEREFTVVDECDLVETELMKYVQFHISAKKLFGLDVEPPKKSVHKKTIVEWIHGKLVPAIQGKLDELPSASNDVWTLREIQSWNRLLAGAQSISAGLEANPDLWVREYGSNNGKAGEGEEFGDSLTLKPVSVSHLGGPYLLKHSAKWLFMSGTIISAEGFGQDIGISPTDWELVKVPMTFPVECRPVVYAPVADMTYKKEWEERGKLLEGVELVCREHENENILVHTNSYKLNKYLYFELKDRLGGRVISYGEARFRDGALQQFRQRGGVLLAPSMERGIDLPDELCTVSVIAKLPYPSLQDKQVSTRIHTPGGQLWYDVQTVRTFIQMAGRGVRHNEDFCITYILDKQFGAMQRKNKSLIPDYFQEGLRYGVNTYRDVYKKLVRIGQ